MSTINVTNTGDSGAGSLRKAIASAKSGDVIKFAPKLAGKTITLKSQLEVPAGLNLTIDGGNAKGLTISGADKHRILLLQSTSATPSRLTVKNLTLADGYTSDRGGAISTEHQGQVVVENVLFKGNKADKGGGAIFTAFEGTLSVQRSKFIGNVAIADNDERGAGAIAFWGPRECTIVGSLFRKNRGINGGAINSLNGKLTIKNSKFFDNDVSAASYNNGEPNPSLRGYGGAIYADRASSTSEPSGTIKLLNTIFDGNKGRAAGGAVYLYTGGQDNVVIDDAVFKDNAVTGLRGGEGGNAGALMVMSNEINRGLKLSNAAFINNTAKGQGGGIWTMNSPGLITNATFSGNRVTGKDTSNVGGAMTLYSPTEIINSTIAKNYAGWVGGGISAGDGNNVSVKNTIFYKNTADNGSNDWGIQQHTNRELIDKGGNIQYPPKATNLGNDYNATANVKLIDPKLGGLELMDGMYVYPLQKGSPAIDKGVNGAPKTDQLGVKRDGEPDIGAFEFGTASRSRTLSVSPSPLEIEGTREGDRLRGSKQGDTILGLGGGDTILGGAGDDGIVGGRGNDELTGGSGRDSFVYEAFRDRSDVITDFNPRKDILNLLSLFTGNDFSSDRPFKKYVQIQQEGDNVVVKVNPLGDRQPGTFERLATLENVSAEALGVQNVITSVSMLPD